MHQTRHSIFTVGLLILTYFLVGCKTDIKINRYIDKNVPLKLTLTTIDTATGFSTQNNFEIAVYSIEYKKLIAWGDTNVTGWTQTIASYAPEVFVGQGDFRLLTIEKGSSVVIGFTDDNNKPRLYIKTIKNGDLDFLKK